MKKAPSTFFAIMALLVVVLAIVYALKDHKPQAISENAAPVIIAGAPSVQYKSDQLEFSFWYPEGSSAKTDNFEGYLSVTKTPIVAVTLAPSLFQGTNLREAGVFIGASSSPAVVGVCAAASADTGEHVAGSVDVGMTTFSVFTSTDAGAGNFYDARTYRTIHNGTCFEIVEMLHSSNINNYTPGTVQPFDLTKFSSTLEAIMNTFVFNTKDNVTSQ